jgi:hypothetical protein
LMPGDSLCVGDFLCIDAVSQNACASQQATP